MQKFLSPLSHAKAPKEAQPVLDSLRRRLGTVPALYATVAHSAPALTGYLAFTSALGGGVLQGAEIEVAHLAVAEAHQCPAAVDAYLTAGRLHGLTEAEMQAARTGTSPDPRLQAVAVLARALVLTRGRPATAGLDQFFAAGYSKAALVELLGVVAASTFHCYVVQLGPPTAEKPRPGLPVPRAIPKPPQ